MILEVLSFASLTLIHVTCDSLEVALHDLNGSFIVNAIANQRRSNYLDLEVTDDDSAKTIDLLFTLKGELCQNLMSNFILMGLFITEEPKMLTDSVTN